MANTLGYYNPEFYAQEALIQLENALGAVSRIHRGYDAERRTFNKGEYINISGPASFTVADAPATAQDVTTQSIQMQLSYWREVKFKLTDKELAFTTEKIINDHIRPAAYALANDVEEKFYALYTDIPWYHDVTTAAVGDITTVNQILFDNKVPRGQNREFAMSSKLEKQFMDLSVFHQANTGGAQADQARANGYLGSNFGLNFFASQNAPTHTPGTFACAAPLLDGAVAAGATSITMDHASSLTGTLVAGDIITIAGDDQQYVVTATATASGNSITASISPAAAAAYADNAACTVDVEATKVVQSLVFHKNAFALATAALPSIGGELGARISSVTDPATGLAIRARLYYVGDSSEVHVALDILYGLKTLDEQLALRVRQAA